MLVVAIEPPTRICRTEKIDESRCIGACELEALGDHLVAEESGDISEPKPAIEHVKHSQCDSCNWIGDADRSIGNLNWDLRNTMTWMARKHCLNQLSKPFNITHQDDDISWFIARSTILIGLVEQVEKLVTY